MPKLHFPSLHNAPRTGAAALPCGLNADAHRFATLWLAHVAHADEMRCDERLVRAAQDHAQWLDAHHDKNGDASMHSGAGGSSPNERVRASGYPLPNWHGGGNTVESASRTNPSDAERALERLLNSPGHRKHLLGEGFWRDSTAYGVGSAGQYRIVVTAPEEGE